MNQTVSDIEESDMTQWLSCFLPASEILDPEPFLFTYGAAQHNQRNVWDIENIQYKYFFSYIVHVSNVYKRFDGTTALFTFSLKSCWIPFRLASSTLPYWFQQPHY